MEGRAETDEQKRIIVERLYSAWCAVPSLRLGQFIEDVFYRDVYYIEDEDFVKSLEAFVEKYGRKEKKHV